MGYYSEFKEDGTDIHNIAGVLDRYTDPYTWEDDSYGVYLSSAKWYDWMTDLGNLAKDYPDNYLIILRHGEEGGDIERAVVKNGRVITQRPKLVWPPVE